MRINPLDKMALGGAVDLAQLTQIMRGLVIRISDLETTLNDCTKIQCESCDCKEESDEGSNATNRSKNGGRTRKDVSSS